MGHEGHLSFTKELILPSITPEDVLWAITAELSAEEGQALEYFAGYCLYRTMKTHCGDCESCQSLGTKMTVETKEIQGSEMFLWLKRYNTDSATLYRAGQELRAYVKNIVLVTNFLFFRYIALCGISAFVKQAVLKFIAPPAFCSNNIREKFVTHTIRTLLHYKVKWLNESIRTDFQKSAKKLKVLRHS